VREMYRRTVSIRKRFVFLVIGFLAVTVGCSVLSPSPTPTLPAVSTPTAQETEREAHRTAYETAKAADVDAWLARQGVKVIGPENKDPEKSPTCPVTFPVAGVAYGDYYLPSDKLYPQDDIIENVLYLTLCFATEQDAINAGYHRGPH
jgi:hypothetical protein